MVRLQKAALRGILIPVDRLPMSEASSNERCQLPGTVESIVRTEGKLLHDSL